MNRITRTAVGVAVLWFLTALGGIALLAFPLVATGDWRQTAFVFELACAGLACGTMGGLIALRQPENRIGWLLALAGLGIVVTFGGFGYGAALTDRLGRDDFLAGLVSWSGIVAFHPLTAALGLVVILFPDGHLPSPRWRLPVRLTIALTLATAVVLAVVPDWDLTLARNPFGLDQVLVPGFMELMQTVPNFNFFFLMGLGILAVAVRFRRSRGDTREQLKWFLAASAAVAVTSFPASEPPWFEILLLVGTASLSLVPIAIAVAVLRHNLYAIDRIISRTLGWAIVSATLVAAFALLVVGLQTLLASVTEASTISVAASTLVAAALFQPLRARIQRMVDRRFDRTRYDAEQTLRTFAGRLRDRVDLGELEEEISATVTSALRPGSTAVWLRSWRRDALQ